MEESMAASIEALIARWDANEGKPYKGSLIDWAAYEAAGGDGITPPADIGCACAQGQVLLLAGGWEPQRLRDTPQRQADAETAKLLNISRAHAILLRNVNDQQDGAPSVVLTDPPRVLGDQWSKLLDFWWAFDRLSPDDWRKVAAVGDAAAWDAARAAARAAAGDAAAWDAAWDAAGDAAGDAARAAVGEIMGFELLGQRGRDVFFLPMFGWASPADIPARPADYGLGIVPGADQ
jgi:hypothetical protein